MRQSLNGEAIRLARELAGLSGRELGRALADALKLRRPGPTRDEAYARLISRLERGEVLSVQPAVGEALARVLGVELDELAVPPVCCRECGRPRRLG